MAEIKILTDALTKQTKPYGDARTLMTFFQLEVSDITESIHIQTPVDSKFFVTFDMDIRTNRELIIDPSQVTGKTLFTIYVYLENHYRESGVYEGDLIMIDTENGESTLMIPDFEITPAQVIIKPKGAYKKYGSENPVFEYEVLGLISGETETAAFPDGATVSTNATTISPIGNYVTTVAFSSTGSNYTAIAREGVFKIINSYKFTVDELLNFSTNPEDIYGVLKNDGILVDTYEENYFTRVFVYDYLFTEFIVRTREDRAISCTVSIDAVD